MLYLEKGPPVSIIAVIWMAFAIVILSFLASPRPDATDMNYTVVVVGGWISLCLVYYFFPVYGGMYWFRGPVSNVEGKVEAEESKSSVDLEKVIRMVL